MNATATKTENDGRQWFAVQFEDGESETFGLTIEGELIDSDGMPVDDLGNARNVAALRAVERANDQVEYDGQLIDITAARMIMDDEICEELHGAVAVTTQQAFMDAYAKAHRDRFGSDFVFN